MKRVITKAAALFSVVLVLFSTFLALPVYASQLGDYVLTDWLGGYGGGNGTLSYLFWGVQEQLYKYVDYNSHANPDDYLVYPSSPSGGGGGGGRGDDGHDILTQPRNYYVDTTIKPYSYTAPTGGGGNINAYQSGNTTTTSLVSTTYNENTDNRSYYFNMPTYNYNNITNNYYNQYDIKNIYYNETYNTYNIQTTNNYNYYVTYAPTFVNITYLDGGNTGNAVSNVYFYQMPDGRNSWDLTHDEVFGMYFLYNSVNYDLVVEDSKTMGLFHLDGNMNDESAYSGSTTYTKGGSHNYVEHAGFDRALYWGNTEQALQFNTGGGGTLEFMLYTAAPTVVPKLIKTTFTATKGSNATDPWVYSDTSPHLESGYTSSLLQSGALTSILDTDTLKKDRRVTTYQVEKQIGWLVDGSVPLYLSGVIQLVEEYEHHYKWVAPIPGQNGSPPVPGYYERTSSKLSGTYSPVSGEIGIKVNASNARGYEIKTLPVGSWNYMAVSGGSLFVNGMRWDAQGIAGVGGSVTISKPAEWNNYWYLDEVRMTGGALYSGTYTPQGHPFDTNKVMVLPASGANGDIAVKSNIPVKSMRVGGARPTYPAVGDVFISVEKTDGKHLVKSIQQYQTGGWIAVDGSIRQGDEWHHLKDYDLKAFTLDDTDFPNSQLRRFEGSTIRFNGPENAIQKIVVHGQTYETGSGTRGPDNPHDVYGLENPIIKVNGTEYTMPTNGELWAGDTRSSEGTENHATGARTFTGAENFATWGVANTTREFASDALGVPTLPTNDTVPAILSTHFAAPVSPGQLWNMSTPGFSASYRFFFRTTHGTVADFKAWLAAENSAGHPVKVVYPLSSPTTASHAPTVFTNAAGEVVIEGPANMEVWAYVTDDTGGGTDPGTDPGGDGSNWWDKLTDIIKDIIGKDDGGSTPGEDGNWWDDIWGILEKVLALIAKLAEGIVTIISKLFEGLMELVGFTERFGAFIGEAFVFIPPEIVTVMVVGLCLAVILMIINFFR